MTFDKDGYEALKRAGDTGLESVGRTSEALAFKFLLDAFAEQRLAIRALNDRVKGLEQAAAGDARYAEHSQDRDDPDALEVW